MYDLANITAGMTVVGADDAPVGKVASVAGGTAYDWSPQAAVHTLSITTTSPVAW